MATVSSQSLSRLHICYLYPRLDQAAQDKVRDKAKGRGLLYPDTFSEERLLFLPPATSVLLVLFSRNHNVRIRSTFKHPHISLLSTPSILLRES